MIIQKDLQGNILAEYKSKAAAARALGVDESTIRRSIKFGRKVMGKFKFHNSKEVSGKIMKVLNSPAKILIVDIETSPIRSYTWGLWKQNIYLDQIISNWFMLTWAAKWLGEEEVLSDKLNGKEVIEEDDERIIISLWKLLDQADIVVAHNGNSFDIPKMNSRFIVHGLNPPSPYKQIDTKIIAKNQFGFSSNKLQALAEMFGYEGKFDTDFELWSKCMQGDEESLKYMETYNKQDVLVLENVYLKLRPYAKGHPNVNMYVDEEEASCPHCGGKHLQLIEGKYFYTQAVRYSTFRCMNCGAISRSKSAVKYNFKKKISAIPK